MNGLAVGILWIDERQNGLGLPSRIAEPFGSSSVFGSTLARLTRCRSVDRWLLLVASSDQVEKVRHLAGDSWEIRVADSPLPGWTPVVRRCRKWSLNGWRGGLNFTTTLDEECHPALFARIAGELNADWIVQVRAESPMVDPVLIDAMVDRARNFTPAPPLVYGSIPPGLAGCVYRPDFLNELGQKGIYPGVLCGYRATEPAIELPEMPFSFKPSTLVTTIPVRLLADNSHALEMLRQLHAHGCDDAESVATMLNSHPHWLVPTSPAEIEVEITTRRTSRPPHLPTADRLPMTLQTWKEIVREYVDSTPLGLLTIGGHGDPLLHPECAKMIEWAKEAGVFGIAVQADVDGLSPAVAQSLLDGPLDILCVRMDGHSQATYQRMNGGDFQQAVAAIERFIRQRNETKPMGPRVVVSMTRCKATLAEMESFYDFWNMRADGVVITPHRDFASQMPADLVLNLCPPLRSACRRIHQRMMIHSDGNIVSCAEDYLGKQSAGTFPSRGLKDAWQSRYAQWRGQHTASDWTNLPLCESCKDWHRP